MGELILSLIFFPRDIERNKAELHTINVNSLWAQHHQFSLTIFFLLTIYSDSKKLNYIPKLYPDMAWTTSTNFSAFMYSDFASHGPTPYTQIHTYIYTQTRQYNIFFKYTLKIRCKINVISFSLTIHELCTGFINF